MESNTNNIKKASESQEKIEVVELKEIIKDDKEKD